jgi:pteridine reductase
MQNHQKVALITGAARRIGATIARVLHQSGINVLVHYHTSQDEAEQLCDELNALRGNSAVAVQADLSVMTNASLLIEHSFQAWGRLDVLVNNASRFYKTFTGEVTESHWDDLLANNVKAPFFLCQAAVPYLREHAGCIVNITDIHAERPVSDYPVYCISKAGLVMLTKALAKELGPDIRVNAVSPGAIVWPEGENSLSEELKQKIVNRTTLQRGGEPLDIAKAVLYFVRDAEYVTGQILGVDGGRSLRA